MAPSHNVPRSMNHYGRTNLCMLCTTTRRGCQYRKAFHKRGLKDSTDHWPWRHRNKLKRSQGLPHRAGPQVQAVQRCPCSRCKMLAGRAYTERVNQLAGIVYRNIWKSQGQKGGYICKSSYTPSARSRAGCNNMNYPVEGGNTPGRVFTASN